MNIFSSKGHQLGEDFAAGFVFNIQDDRHILVLDERIHFYLQAVLYQKIREVIGGKVDPMNPATFLEVFNDIQDNVLSNFLSSIYDEEKIKNIPIFDAEFGFNVG